MYYRVSGDYEAVVGKDIGDEEDAVFVLSPMKGFFDEMIQADSKNEADRTGYNMLWSRLEKQEGISYVDNLWFQPAVSEAPVDQVLRAIGAPRLL